MAHLRAALLTAPALLAAALIQRPVDFRTLLFDGGTEVGFDWLGRPLNASETSLAANGAVTVSGGHFLTVVKDTGHAIHFGP